MSASVAVERSWPAEAASVPAARRFVRAHLHEHSLEGLTENAELLVTELVSNVVLHAETDLDVRLDRYDSRVRVEVHDRNPTLPQRKFYSPTSATGRGMVFIAELSKAWGAEPTAEGKVVWLELDDTPPPAAAVQAPGAEFRLEDWEDWDDWGDLEPPSVTDDPEAEPNGRGGSASNRTERELVGCR